MRQSFLPRNKQENSLVRFVAIPPGARPGKVYQLETVCFALRGEISFREKLRSYRGWSLVTDKVVFEPLENLEKWNFSQFFQKSHRGWFLGVPSSRLPLRLHQIKLIENLLIFAISPSVWALGGWQTYPGMAIWGVVHEKIH